MVLVLLWGCVDGGNVDGSSVDVGGFDGAVDDSGFYGFYENCQ